MTVVSVMVTASTPSSGAPSLLTKTISSLRRPHSEPQPRGSLPRGFSSGPGPAGAAMASQRACPYLWPGGLGWARLPAAGRPPAKGRSAAGGKESERVTPVAFGSPESRHHPPDVTAGPPDAERDPSPRKAALTAISPPWAVEIETSTPPHTAALGHSASSSSQPLRQDPEALSPSLAGLGALARRPRWGCSACPSGKPPTRLSPHSEAPEAPGHFSWGPCPGICHCALELLLGPPTRPGGSCGHPGADGQDGQGGGWRQGPSTRALRSELPHKCSRAGSAGAGPQARPPQCCQCPDWPRGEHPPRQKGSGRDRQASLWAAGSRETRGDEALGPGRPQ